MMIKVLVVQYRYYLKVAGSILTSGGGIEKKIVIFFSPWSLGSDIQRLALSDNGRRFRVQVAHVKNPLAILNFKKSRPDGRCPRKKTNKILNVKKFYPSVSLSVLRSLCI
jgi:hypothetical protein